MSAPLPRIVSVRPAGKTDARSGESVTLDFDDRHRRRTTFTTSKGRTILLDMADVQSLQDGDRLVLDDDTTVMVTAAPEALMEVTCTDPAHMVRVAWHLGNRHLPTELGNGILRIRADHVIATMVKGLGATVRDVTAAFNPEGGAYGHGRVHGHSHGDEPTHHHDHGHDH